MRRLDLSKTGPLPTMAEIARAVCDRYGVSRIDLISDRRSKRIVGPRHVACYLAAKLSRKSTPSIGRAMGGRDHTTIMHALRSIEGRLQDNPELAAEINVLEEQLRAVASRRGDAPGEPICIADLARRVKSGGYQAALSLSIDEIMAICDALNEHIERSEPEPEDAEPSHIEAARRYIAASRRLDAWPSHADESEMMQTMALMRRSGDPLFNDLLIAERDVATALYTRGERAARERRAIALANLAQRIEEISHNG